MKTPEQVIKEREEEFMSYMAKLSKDIKKSNKGEICSCYEDDFHTATVYASVFNTQTLHAFIDALIAEQETEKKDEYITDTTAQGLPARVKYYNDAKQDTITYLKALKNKIK